jgi:hypothetical protein
MLLLLRLLCGQRCKGYRLIRLGCYVIVIKIVVWSTRLLGVRLFVSVVMLLGFVKIVVWSATFFHQRSFFVQYAVSDGIF